MTLPAAKHAMSVCHGRELLQVAGSLLRLWIEFLPLVGYDFRLKKKEYIVHMYPRGSLKLESIIGYHYIYYQYCI